MDEIKTFLAENDELLQTSTSDEIIHPKIVGNYSLDRFEVSNQVIDWIFHYLENRKCPYRLAVAIAKRTAEQIELDIANQLQEDKNSKPEKLLNSVTLYNESIRKVSSVCNYFLEHGEEQLSSPCSEPHIASVFAIKNKRRKMEDRHVVHHDLNLLLGLKDMPPQSFFGIFDGHAGIDAASYGSAHLHVNLANHPSFLTDTPTAVAEAYKITDENFSRLCKTQDLKGGSTAICALIREKTVYLSWLGDSQAVLVKEGKPAIVTNPHKPERQDEQKRIEDLGGHITFMGVCRVNGVLAVTRALGDLDHKPYISNEPDVTTIHLTGKEDFLILGCDGLWDGMSPEDVTSALYHNLSENALDEPLDAVAAKLVHQSKLQGSEDNITAVVVFLRDITKIKKYATELVHQSSSQLNFLGMNGEGNVRNAEGMVNVPYSKPTVLELNAASTKKLKNAANVQSVTGYMGEPYQCPYPESPADELHHSHLISDEERFEKEFIACLLPEATVFSELPTPPIDDIVASQQFENLCSEDLRQGLNSLSSELHGFAQNSDVAANTANVNCNSMSLVQESAVITTENNNAFKDNLVMKSDFEKAITPDEALGIASNVVSNTIETAVKCISSSELCEPIPVISTQKLNPYAEPFVMKSFVLGDDQTHEEEDNTIPVPSSNNEIAEQIAPEKLSTESIKCIENPLENRSGVMINNSAIDDFKTDKLEPHNVLSSPDSENQSSKLGSDVSADTSKEGLLACEFSLLDLKDPGSSYHAEMSEDPLLMDQNNLPNQLKDLVPKESEKLDTLLDVDLKLSSDNKLIDKTFGNSPTPEINPFEKMQNLETIVSIDNIDLDVSSNLKIQNSDIDESSKEESQGNKSLTLIKTDQDFPEGGSFQQPPCVSENVNLNNFVEQEDNEQISNHVHDKSSVEMTQNVFDTLNAHLPCDSPAGFLLEGEKSIFPDACILDNVTQDPLTLLNIKGEEKPSAAILPSDQVDDCHIETFAVDLQTVPDGVPEAEGVTEDVDSDSEKDGGWSYMKGNTVGSVKPKSNESTPKGLKSASKPDSLSKLKKDVLKPALENKSSPKNAIFVDKTKKPVAEKKTLDVKDRKPARMVSSTLPKSTIEKTAKPVSTISRVKKETHVSKITAVPPSKTTRLAAPRNATALNKPVQNTTTERTPTGSTKVVGNTLGSGNVRPKSTLNTLTTKTNTRPGGTSTLSKGQPSTQSTKSNIMPATRSATLNRPAASTVPSKALTKPLIQSKPAATESKPKPLPNTIKRTLPSTLKRPDIKETKDIVNKQISAKSTLGASGRNEVKSASSSNKHSATLNNKPLPTKARTLIKNEVIKKDVPKPAISKLNTKSTAPSKISRDITKGKVTKSVSIQEKKTEKIDSDGNVQKAEKIASVCEEEKFILEVNDKEVAVKEQAETGIISDQMLIPVENGVAENIKPLEEMVSIAISGSETLL